MGSSKGLKSTLVPIAEHRQVKVCDSSGLGDGGVAAGSLEKSRSRRGRDSKVLRPLVKMKNVFVELLKNAGGNSEGGRGTAAYFSMGVGVVMGPVDFGGYEAISHYSARNNNYDSSSNY